MSIEELPAEAPVGDLLAPSLKSTPCPRCGEPFMREVDMRVHLERHRPASQIPKHERKGEIHCPKGCTRLLLPGTPDWEAHVVLCDGSPPIPERGGKSAYKWWCDEHLFGTNGPRGWGDHKREHHDGKEPVQVDAGKKPKAGAVAEATKLLRGEFAKLSMERTKIDMELKRLEAALKALSGEES